MYAPAESAEKLLQLFPGLHWVQRIRRHTRLFASKALYFRTRILTLLSGRNDFCLICEINSYNNKEGYRLGRGNREKGMVTVLSSQWMQKESVRTRKPKKFMLTFRKCAFFLRWIRNRNQKESLLTTFYFSKFSAQWLQMLYNIDFHSTTP
jgi:hypothetical protein